MHIPNVLFVQNQSKVFHTTKKLGLKSLIMNEFTESKERKVKLICDQQFTLWGDINAWNVWW
jgi:hypothetical protein